MMKIIIRHISDHKHSENDDKYDKNYIYSNFYCFIIIFIIESALELISGL